MQDIEQEIHDPGRVSFRNSPSCMAHSMGLEIHRFSWPMFCAGVFSLHLRELPYVYGCIALAKLTVDV